MNIVIINCFDTYEDRVKLIYNSFKKKTNNVTLIKSNYKHMEKEYVKFSTNHNEDSIYIDVRSYNRNLSLNRILSHRDFSIKTAVVLSKLKPDIIYALLPPNSLAKHLNLYKKSNPKVKIIYDIMDLWPETLPLSSSKNTLPFTYWRNMRDNALGSAELIITECNYYQKLLKKVIRNKNSETLYLAKEINNMEISKSEDRNKINLAYLGSINNIIDIDKISEIISHIHKIKPVHLHIIGDGEKRENLIKSAKQAGATVTFYGKVYDSQIKQNIFNKCHYGLNIMKPSVRVGLTMKSIDYFRHGLPIINNIPYDTKEIVNEYRLGLNIFSISDYNTHFNNAITEPGHFKKEDVNAAFNKLFSDRVFMEKLTYLLNKYKLIL